MRGRLSVRTDRASLTDSCIWIHKPDRTTRHDIGTGTGESKTASKLHVPGFKLYAVTTQHTTSQSGAVPVQITSQSHIT